MITLTGTDVVIVEDDASLRQALQRLLVESGYSVQGFASAEGYLAAPELEGCRCLLLDVRLPGLSGLALQRRLQEADLRRFIVFMTGHSDLPAAVDAMKRGAVDFLLKPIDEKALISAVEKALGHCRKEKERTELGNAVDQSLSQLTPREKDVMMLVIKGLPNKIIAGQLGIALQTVKIHRSRVMAKMQAGSVVELVRLVELVGIRVEGATVLSADLDESNSEF